MNRRLGVSRRQFLKEVFAAGTCGALSSLVSASALQSAWGAEATESSDPARWRPADPPNRPIGRPKGIFPGRVVWMHDPAIARWDGDTSGGGWFEDRFTDPALADRMLSEVLRVLTGTRTEAAAWTALFQHFNRTHGRGQAGYRPGEKVAVKLNLNCSKRRADSVEGPVQHAPVDLCPLASTGQPSEGQPERHRRLRRLALRERLDLHPRLRPVSRHPLRGPRRP
jgi:hypothetical protein